MRQKMFITMFKSGKSNDLMLDNQWETRLEMASLQMETGAQHGDDQEEKTQSSIEPTRSLSSKNIHPEGSFGIFKEPVSVMPYMPEAEPTGQSSDASYQQLLSHTAHDSLLLRFRLGPARFGRRRF
jgi:hypothetical protein